MPRKSAHTFMKTSRKTLPAVRHGLQTLPLIFHLSLFVLFVLISVMSFNFEVFRVVRIGDLFILFFAFLIGVQWYGQRMLETGYKDGLRKAAEAAKNKRK